VGATRNTRRLENRSMISARAAIEQMSSGQIGQPAACMIESNMALSVSEGGWAAPVASIMACRREPPKQRRVARDFPDMQRCQG